MFLNDLVRYNLKMIKFVVKVFLYSFSLRLNAVMKTFLKKDKL